MRMKQSLFDSAHLHSGYNLDDHLKALGYTKHQRANAKDRLGPHFEPSGALYKLVDDRNGPPVIFSEPEDAVPDQGRRSPQWEVKLRAKGFIAQSRVPEPDVPVSVSSNLITTMGLIGTVSVGDMDAILRSLVADVVALRGSLTEAMKSRILTVLYSLAMKASVGGDVKRTLHTFETMHESQVDALERAHQAEKKLLEGDSPRGYQPRSNGQGQHAS